LMALALLCEALLCMPSRREFIGKNSAPSVPQPQPV
jgi:hypothetical protein